MSNFVAKNGIHFAATPPAKPWVIDNVIPEGVGIVYGPSGAGKSFFALELAGAVATGKPLFGQFPVKQGIVVYVMLEGEFASRWYLYRKQHHLLVAEAQKAEVSARHRTAEDYKDAMGGDHSERFDEDRYWRLVDKDQRNTQRDLRELSAAGRVVQFDEPLSLSNPDSVGALIDGIKAELSLFHPTAENSIQLVIIDTLSKATGGEVDENTAVGMQRLLKGVEQLRDGIATGSRKPTVLLIHHTGKDGGEMRGSYVLQADVDVKLRLDKANEKVDSQAPLMPLVLECEKMRQGQGFCPEISLVKREYSLYEADEEAELLMRENAIRAKAGAPALEKLDERKSCLIEVDGLGISPSKSASTAGPDNVTKLMAGLAKLNGRANKNAELIEASGVPSGSIDSAKKQAVARGLVKLEGKAIIATPSVAPAA